MTEPAKPLSPDLYKPVSEDAPCGPLLDRTAFLELDQLCTETPGRYDHLTDTELPPTPPEFRAARPVAMGLLDKTRDLRPLTQLILIEAHASGAMGLHAAAHLLLHLCENHWEHVQPGPASDEAELNQRRRALDRIRNRRRVVNALEDVPVFRAKSVFGDVRLRDFLIASGKMLPKDGEPAPDKAGVLEMIASADADEAVSKTVAALEASAAIFGRLEEFFAEAFERPLKLDPIPADLKKYAETLKEYTGNDGVAETQPEGGGSEPVADGTAVAAPEQPMRTGPINSEEEAYALLDDVLAYYAGAAASSPVAMILLRIREMRGASFVDWIDATGSNGPDKAAFDIAGVDMSILQTLLEGGDSDAESEADAEEEPDPAGEILTIVNEMDSAIYELSVTSVTAPPGDSGQDPATTDTGENTGDEVAGMAGQTSAEQHLGTLRGHADALRNLAYKVQAALEAPATSGARSGKPTGSITSRSAVKTALEQLANFHDARDPASAIQTILRRTKGLVDLNYLDTLAELSPGGGRPALPLIRPQPKGRR